MSSTLIHLRKFLPLVLPHAPGCSDFVATFNLRIAAIEFCERTLCWRHISNVTLNKDGKALTAPPYAAIHKIESATFDDEIALEPLQYSHVDEAAFAETAGATPQYITQAEYNKVRVLPYREGKLSLSLFLKPVNGSEMIEDFDGMVSDAYDVVPEFIYTMHAEAIAAGALSRLLVQPNKPWANPQAAMMWGQKATDAMETHFTANITGQHRARRRTKYHDF
ncbi:hypothetical protein [Yoonia sp.]|uniref:hypothetical protein n=1 Tax=Yoonia sp. TaxID=2212373 RepID=UPI002DFE9C1E|nr:hypothetical protein [Yoonia sp.]